MKLAKQGILKTGQAAWRLLPRELRRQGASRVAAVLAAKPDKVPPRCSNGVVVAGDVAFTNGLAESGRILHEVVAAHGLARGFVPLGLPGFVPMEHCNVPRDAALLSVVNSPIFPIGLLRMPRDFLAGRRVIGVWAWELPLVPRSWYDGTKFVHEVWTPSTFTAQALEPLAPGRVRVVPFPMAEIDLPAEGDRADFGLPEGVFIVTTMFNLASSMVRKNPLGAIAAFKAAFGSRRDHVLVMKLSNTEAYQEDLNLIRAAICDAPNIKLITETVSESRLRGLMLASDVILSLHRSEGFGLIPAAAMLLGRPVVATGWSGNLEFMAPEVSALVSYKLIPALDPRGTYDMPQTSWADPDIEDAAMQLRHLAENTAARHAMAEAGQAYARTKLSAGPLLSALATSGIA
jgi:glycosyltransferase involved in cell wall biosynthesis